MSKIVHLFYYLVFINIAVSAISNINLIEYLLFSPYYFDIDAHLLKNV